MTFLTFPLRLPPNNLLIILCFISFLTNEESEEWNLTLSYAYTLVHEQKPDVGETLNQMTVNTSLSTIKQNITRLEVRKYTDLGKPSLL